ncbi:GspE/PulE family protein [Thiohalobacter sp.]|uniref:GspE/PulE family protein n=1 Tax=Thiohalobacter sp. TaxID=2025948 RepID=UPI00262BFB85|nr:GspE/PulE family protein [Thiohalobacter sp.]
MGKLLSLPVENFAGEGAAGTPVRVELLSGDAREGRLGRFDPLRGELSLHHADGPAETFRFADMRRLLFTTDLSHALNALPEEAHAPQPLWLRYRDGRTREDTFLDVRIDHHGLHLLVDAEGRVQREFVPFATLARYRVGSVSGQPDRAGGTPPDGVVRSREQLAVVMASRTPLAPIAAASSAATDPEALARRLAVPLVDLADFDVEPEVLADIPENFAREHRVMPLLRINDRLIVAMENPADAELLSLLHFVSGHSVEGCVAAPEDLQQTIERAYGVADDAEALDELELVAQKEMETQPPVHEVERMGKEKPIVRLVHNILAEAIRRDASDIHLRPADDHVALLYRQDGTLVPVRKFAKVLLPAVVARIKIIGRMNIAERRLPQDGRARMVEAGRTVDMRISVIPTVSGESVVIRLLNADNGLRSISELGFTLEDAERFTDLLHRSYGMLLVTGPTGSGKSTTLYAALQEVRKQNVNIITVEDPVEYRVQGIEQIQVNTAPGFTFARALRNILRHDPDVIMVGEIRDQETAKIAVESALTGHLVLSTLHTNDAPTTVTRLIEMGVAAFLVKSSLLGVLAQRLVRLNCPHCIELEPVDTSVRRCLGVGEDEVFHRGQGCEACNHTGFHGRMAVYELLRVTPAMRDIITADVSADAIRQQAMRDGMVPLTQNALRLAREQKTSLAEVYRVRLE